jgi:peroxiredoxin
MLRAITSLWRKRTEMTNIPVGSIAPDFSVSGLDGKAYDLRALLKRGPVVVTFFKSSCPVCQFTAPFLERLFQRYGGGDVTMLGISQDDPTVTAKFVSQFGMTFPVATDAKGYPASNVYGLTMVPTIFLIDVDGTVRVSSMGFNKADLESIAAYLAGRQRVAPAIFFRAEERVPEQRPG